MAVAVTGVDRRPDQAVADDDLQRKRLAAEGLLHHGEEVEDRQRQAEDDAENGRHDAARHPEGAVHVRMPTAKIDHRKTDDREGQRGAEGDQIAQHVDREERRYDGDGAAEQDGADPGRPEPGVNDGEHPRQEAVPRHGVEDAGLGVGQHQHDGRQAGEGADLDRQGHQVELARGVAARPGYWAGGGGKIPVSAQGSAAPKS